MRASLLLLAGALLALPAVAQTDWRPTRPVRLVVPYSAGGATDASARVLAERLDQALGQTVVVDNKPGANGLIGSQLVLSAPPDGHTFLVGTVDTQAINPVVYTNLAFQPHLLLPVVPVSRVGTVLAGRKGSEPLSMREVVALGRAGKLTYGHWGVGGLAHAAGELLKIRAGMPDVQAIPFQGSAPGLQALLGGQIDLMFLPMNLALGNGERLNIVGVASSERFEGAKASPTLAEGGFPIEAETWVGLFAPPGTPKPVIDAMHKAVTGIASDAAVKKRWLEMGIGTQSSRSPEEYAAFVRAEQARWRQVIADTGLKLTQ